MSIKARDAKGRIISVVDKSAAFKSKIKYSEDIEDCWEWLAGKDWDGYGMFWHTNRNVRAARYSYELFVDKIPIGYLICHKCDNTGCVNPNHLFLGTPKDNTQDMIKKGRNAFKKGIHPEHLKNIAPSNKKLTIDQIKYIKTHQKKQGSLSGLAKEFNVSLSCVCAVYCGRTWRDI